jgi:hypothetical protein
MFSANACCPGKASASATTRTPSRSFGSPEADMRSLPLALFFLNIP